MSYLGLINYFRDFIPMYSRLAAPLEELRHLPSIPTSSWTPSRQRAFQQLKDTLASSVFLSFPDFKRRFFVATDASRGGVAGVLYQLENAKGIDEVSNRRFILFAARALHKSERQYSATKLELLAIVFSLRKFHFYIYGSSFSLFTDHRALTFLFSQNTLSPMLGNWLEVLLSFSFTITHRPGISNVLPDALSRIFTAEPSPIDAIASRDPLTIMAHQVSLVDKPGPKLSPSAQQEAIATSHLRGHFGVKAVMANLLRQGLRWPKIRQDVENVVRSCPQCQRFTISQAGFHPLQPTVASMPMEAIALDTALSFPSSTHGNNVLLVVVCVFSRFVLLRPHPDRPPHQSPKLSSCCSVTSVSHRLSLVIMARSLSTSFFSI